MNQSGILWMYSWCCFESKTKETVQWWLEANDAGFISWEALIYGTTIDMANERWLGLWAKVVYLCCMHYVLGPDVIFIKTSNYSSKNTWDDSTYIPAWLCSAADKNPIIKGTSPSFCCVTLLIWVNTYKYSCTATMPFFICFLTKSKSK